MHRSKFLKQGDPILDSALELIAGVGAKTREPNYRIKVQNIEKEEVIISIFLGMETDCFRDIKDSKSSVIFGVGDHVYCYSRRSNAILSKKLDGYFGYLYPAQDIESEYFEENVLVSDASTLILMNHDGKVLWEAENLGIDGVVVNSIKKNIIYGEGEFDPPGGWEEFEINLKNGKHT